MFILLILFEKSRCLERLSDLQNKRIIFILARQLRIGVNDFLIRTRRYLNFKNISWALKVLEIARKLNEVLFTIYII